MTVLLITLGLLGLLDVAASRWGADTRDGRDWQPGWWSPGSLAAGRRHVR